MPTQEDEVFLRSAVESGVLDAARAEEVLSALERVEELGARSSAREIAINRGFLSEIQAEEVASAGTDASGTDGSEATPRPRKQVGNYEPIAKLGTSHGGLVCKARQLTLDREVALHVLPPRAARDPAFLERFLREARAAAKLSHPNLVRVYDVGEDDGLCYLATELVDGETLLGRLEGRRRLPQAQVLEIARHVALALEHAHAHGVVHGEISPESVLLTRGEARLANLGLAVPETADRPPSLYTSPEQARGGQADARSDIYSLGATLYHVAVGSAPFATVGARLTEGVSSPRRTVPSLSEGLCVLLTKMLARDPDSRYQSASELLRDLERVSKNRPPVGVVARTTPAAARRTRPAPRKRPSRMPLLVSGGAVGAAILVILGFVLFGGAGRRGAARQGPRPRGQAPRPQARSGRGDPAAAELERVRQWEGEKRRDPKSAIRQYRLMISHHPYSAAAEQARQRVAQLQARAREGERAKLNEAMAEATRLAEAEKFSEAVALIDRFGESCREFPKEVNDARGRVISDATGLDRKLRDEARTLAEQGDLSGAIALYTRITAFGIPQLTGRAKRELAALETKRAAAEREARASAQAAYLALRAQAAPLLEARDYAGARAMLEKGLADPALAGVRAELEADRGDLDAVAGLWAAAEKAAGALKPGEAISVGGAKGTFERFEGGVLHFRASETVHHKPLKELLASEVAALAARQLPADKPDTLLATGLFLLAEGKTKEATTAFAEAQKAGADVARHQALVVRRAADVREGAALALLNRANAAVEADEWPKAADALATLRRDYADTRTATTHRDHIDKLLAKARVEAVGPADLFHGACRTLEDGKTLEITYDFAKAAQLDDWVLRDGSLKLDDGGLLLRSACVFFRAPLEGDLQAVLELADATGPPGAWGLLLAEDPAAEPFLDIALPEQAGQPLVARAGGRPVARAPVAFRPKQSRKLDLCRRGRRVNLAVDGRDAIKLRSSNGTLPQAVRLGFTAHDPRGMAIRSLVLTARVSQAWADAEVAQLRAFRRRCAQFAERPPRLLTNGVTITPWTAQHGKWAVEDVAVTTPTAGNIVLQGKDYGDIELRLKVRPTKATSVVRVGFRAHRNGERYAVILGGAPFEGALMHVGVAKTPDQTLARFTQPVAWQPGQWVELRIVAVGPALRVDAGGAPICRARHAGRPSGGFSLDVLRDGAAFRDVSLRWAE